VNHPSNAKLIDEKERGRLLHFFGNHELLATELMALALLKFPEAPASFRQGVLETLKEEQIHTKLYIHRMKQCGVDFGELPLSDYFWKSVSSMEDPLDYVTRLSLTFEQANLDYSREYGKLFEAVGDDATAGILDKIYRDEIGHVGFGLKWFRRWKASEKSDWEAFRECLVFPLSPSRAKGNHFNSEGRSEAGFDESFISNLQVFHQSRGRTPSVLWFNPEAERFAAQNSDQGFEPESSVLQNDLAFLAAFLARRDDLLIMPDRPSQEFLKQIQSYGLPLPEILTCEASTKGWEAPAISRKIGDLRPWAWAPDSVSFFRNMFGSLTRKVDVDTLWNKGLRNLYSKSWSSEWGRELATEGAEENWTAPAEIYGKVGKDLDEVIALREHFASLGYRNIVCKAPFGTAAHGNRCMLADDEWTPVIRAWLTGVWKEQEVVIVEPWLERVYDFSVQFEKRGASMKPLAFTRLINNKRGQFRGIVVNGFCKGIDPEVTRFLMARINRQPRVYRWYEETVGPRLKSALDVPGFNGPLGVDAFVYRDLSGKLRLKTIVELNPRFTMGRLAHELGQHMAAGSMGCFQVLTQSQIQKTKTPRIFDFSEELKQRHPVVLTSEPKPRIVSGSFPLNDPLSAKYFLAVYHVRENIGELPI
ncbi:MAG: DUF455 family protein, partial [Verrucomicrobia bacterium]|nr:DUF455 family protein [Verrucomicrobiota bacterium]